MNIRYIFFDYPEADGNFRAFFTQSKLWWSNTSSQFEVFDRAIPYSFGKYIDRSANFKIFNKIVVVVDTNGAALKQFDFEVKQM